MANAFKSGLSTIRAGARVAKAGIKFVGRNANKGLSIVFDKTTNGLDKLADKMQESKTVETKTEVVVEAEAVKA